MASQRIPDLAKIIQESTETVNDFYSDNQIPPPSIDTGSPLTTVHDEKVAEACFTAVAAMHELKCLMLGPTEGLMCVEVSMILQG